MADNLAAALAALLGSPRQLNLRKYWDAGRLVGDRMILERDWGSSLLKNLASQSGLSESTLAFCARFRKTWPQQRVEAAEKANIPWRNVVDMLTFSQQAARLRERGMNAAAQEIDGMLDDLIAQVSKGAIQPVGIKAYLQAWRKAHQSPFARRLSRKRG